MDEQPGHLTNAEIEHYGEEAVSPEAKAEDRRNRVETHLADCSTCRERVLSSQRARLALLAASSVITAPNADRPGPGPGPGEDDLSRAGLDHRPPDCPDEDNFRRLAAGLCPPDQTTRLTQHAAQCDHCGPLLRMFTEDFADELSNEDGALLGKLKSLSTGWQKKLTQEIVEQPDASRESSDSAARSAKNASRKLSLWRWVLAPTALAACATIAFAVWYSQRETPEKVEKLLAQAYTENRQLEMRIPFAKHAEFHQLRSGDAESALNTPASFRKAADEIQSQLKKEPDDPKWLLLSARLDLLDSHYKPAIATLARIEDEKVLGSSEMLITQALALYEKAGLEPDPQAYGQAVDLLAKALQKEPGNTVALFNQAIACERIPAYECASTDWEQLLKIEKDSAWSGEAQEHLKAIQEKKTLGR